MNLRALDPNLMWYLVLVVLTVAMIIGALLTRNLWNDLKGLNDEPATGPDELLAPLSEAFAAGQMDEAEYQRIRASVERVVTPEPPPKPRPKPAPKRLDDR